MKKGKKYKKNFIISQRKRRIVITWLLSNDVKVIRTLPLYKCKNQVLFDEFEKQKGKTIERHLEDLSRHRPERDNKGQIYVIGNLYHGLIKIGFSINPEKRISGIQVGCPFRVSLLKVFDGTMKQEKKLHKKYRRYNTNGEWFKYEGELKEVLQLTM